MFPSPPKALTQSIDDSWQHAATDAPTSIAKLQHSITRSLEGAVWLRLFDQCGRYQQAILSSLSLNPGCSTWLSASPVTSEPGCRLRADEYRLAVRHRLGLLPYDDMRDEACVTCAKRNTNTPTLLTDPDHAMSCILQEGVSVRRRHDAVKLVLAELAREC
jgi:hypothetical protein